LGLTQPVEKVPLVNDNYFPAVTSIISRH
jgi:hypothetical protein